jgi:hypothetical protein
MKLQSNNTFSTFSCVNLSNLEIGGSWQADIVKHIKFSITPCKNSTLKKCKSLDEIYNYLNPNVKFLSIYTNSYSLQISDPSKPLTINKGLYYTTISNFIRKYILLQRTKSKSGYWNNLSNHN